MKQFQLQTPLTVNTPQACKELSETMIQCGDDCAYLSEIFQTHYMRLTQTHERTFCRCTAREILSIADVSFAAAQRRIHLRGADLHAAARQAVNIRVADLHAAARHGGNLRAE